MRLISILACMLGLGAGLLAACASPPQPTEAPTLPETPTAEMLDETGRPAPAETNSIESAPTPRPTAAPERYLGLAQGVSSSGFPQLGFPNAPVSVTIYAGFDDLASAHFHAETMPALLERVQTGEVLLTFVPVIERVADAIAGGRAAARAALCAGEQDRFWRYHDLLFEATAAGPEPFASAALLALGRAAGLNLNALESCLTSGRPDNTLGTADAQVAGMSLFTRTPYVTVNGVPALTDPASLNFTIDRALLELNQRLAAALAEVTAEPEPAEPTAEAIVIDPLLGEPVDPPLIIGLPADWVFGRDVFLLQDVDAFRGIPIVVYRGPVTGGMGTIVLLWGFPNLVGGGALGGEAAVDLFFDGLRLLRLAVIETGCNIGTDERREYSIGGLAAAGTQFAAVDCPALPDTRGWFAGLQQGGINYIFYAFTEPIDALDAAAPELQAVLDTVRFLTPAPTGE